MYKLFWDWYKSCLPSKCNSYAIKWNRWYWFGLGYFTAVQSSQDLLRSYDLIQKRDLRGPQEALPPFFPPLYLLLEPCLFFHGPQQPLLGMNTITRRFLSGLTLMFPHYVSCTVIHSCVLRLQAAHPQIQHVLAIIPGDGESVLHRVCVLCVTTIIPNPSDPLQILSWSLTDPAHAIVTEGESCGHTGEF